MRYQAFDNRGRRQRPGIVLLLVIAMLTLFAILALSFVFYAEAEAISSQLTSDALNGRLPDSNPETLAAFFFTQFNYGTTNVASAMRGHDIGRGMYGFNPYGANSYAYSGIGRLHYQYTIPSFSLPKWPGPALPPALTNPVTPLDDYSLINYTYYPTDGFVRDPEFYGYRSNPFAGLSPAYYRAGNAPYTYQDLNNMFLALVTADGEVITNSFHRPSGSTGITYLPPIPMLTPPPQPPWFKYQTLPVSPVYHDGLDYQVPPRPLLTSSGTPLGQFNASAIAAGDIKYDFFKNVIGGHVRNLDTSQGFKVTTNTAAPVVVTPTVPVPINVNANTVTMFPQVGTLIIDGGPGSGVIAFVAYNGVNPATNQFLNCTCDKTVPTPIPPNSRVYAYFPNDSYWMDLGYPVSVAPNGRKYKALFAPLIIDLDSRINMWLANGGFPTNTVPPLNPLPIPTTSNRGNGPTEVSIGGMLPPNQNIANSELAALNTLRFGAASVAEPNTYVWTLTPSVPPNPLVQNGTFRITVGNPPAGTTAPIPFNATANVIQAALQAVPAVGPNVYVAGGVDNSGNPVGVNSCPVVITFPGASGNPPTSPIPLSVGTGKLVGFTISALPANLPLVSGPVHARIDASGVNGGALTLPNPSFLWTIVDPSSVGAKLPPAAPMQLNVASTIGFPASGTIAVPTAANGIQLLTYTGTTNQSFTGVTGGNGVIAPGNITAHYFTMPDYPITTTVASSVGTPLPIATGILNVKSTIGFPPTGTIAIPAQVTLSNGATAVVPQLISYTGTGPTSFTGCTGGFGLVSGGPVASRDYAFPNIGQGSNLWYRNAAPGQTVPAEVQGNALGYNIFTKMGRNNLPLGASHMEALLRPQGPGTPASAFMRLMPQTFGTVSASPYSARNRNLVTSHSWSLDRITGAPYLFYDPTAGPPASYSLGAGAYATPTLSPPLTSPAVDGSYNAPKNSDFAVQSGSLLPPEYRSNLVSRLRVNVNRLSGGSPFVGGKPRQVIQYQYDYPPPTGGYIDPTITYFAAWGKDPPWASKIGWTYGDQFTYAQTARQQLAKDIYNVLITVTGAVNPNGAPNDPNAPNSYQVVPPGPANGLAMSTALPGQYNAARWLAQLAVNIVDYVDNDDYMTPFNWDTTATPGPNPWVYGTELPRVLVNEVVVTAPGTITAELHNPFKNTSPPGGTIDPYPYPSDGGTARLQVTPPVATGVPMYPVYQLLVADNSLANQNALSSDPTNTTGTPATSIAAFSTWPAPGTIPPANGALRDPVNGFYVTPAVPAPLPAGSTSGTVLLQRLACPAQPWNATTNPYITVDYMQGVSYAAATFGVGQGRPQPYAGGAPLVSQVNPPATDTFYSHNIATAGSGISTGFDWLPHLDRPLVNTLELLHVSGVFPHQLTQRFVTAAGLKFQHYAPWQDPNAMIYRALELVGVPSYLNGTAAGGRVPGRVNINTANEPEVVGGLIDLGTFANLQKSRTADPNGVPGPNDTPFRSLLSGFIANPPVGPPPPTYDTQYGPIGYGTPTGSGLDDTILRTTGPNQANNQAPANIGTPPYSNLVLGTGAGHPYQNLLALQKVFNNTTTTSNVFAVWLTVGFFEVQDADQTGNPIIPPKIGSEIGRDQGRHIRHRFFAIVDRTGMNLTPGLVTAQQVQPQLLPPPAPSAPQAPAAVTIRVSGMLLNTVAGNLLEIGPDPVNGQTEVVSVTGVDLNGPTITAPFTKAFSAGTPIAFRGNPGPQPRRLMSLLSAPIAKGTTTGVLVAGTVSNVMLAPATGTVTIGDPTMPGPWEAIGVVSIDTTKNNSNPGSPSNPSLNTSPTQGAWPAGTPVIWTSNIQYQPRNDPAVVLHLSVIQ
jgi:hypothetical protein